MRQVRSIPMGRWAGLVAAATLLLAGCAGLESARSGDSSSGTSTADSRTTVDVIALGTMGSSSLVSAGGYVQGVIESGGICSYTLTQGDQQVIGQSDAEPDATTTWCANVDLFLPDPGQPWVLDLRYESATFVGVGRATSTGVIS